MCRIADEHFHQASDRADDLARECRRLQGIIDRIAGAAGTFDLGPLTPAIADAQGVSRKLAIQKARDAIQKARDILSETGDWEGDYPERSRT